MLGKAFPLSRYSSNFRLSDVFSSFGRGKELLVYGTLSVQFSGVETPTPFSRVEYAKAGADVEEVSSVALLAQVAPVVASRFY